MQRATNYVLGVVLFAVALFFAGISIRMPRPGLRMGVLAVGLAVFLLAAALDRDFPNKPLDLASPGYSAETRISRKLNGGHMRKFAAAALATALMIAAMGTAAHAATTSVNGTGSYEKLVVNNGNQNLVFKIHAPGGKCDIKYLQVKFRDRDGTRYEMNGGCYPGAVWAASLVRGDRSIIDCEGFSLKYNATSSVWTSTIPRTCLAALGGAVKVTYSYVDDYSPNINEVPGTKYVAKG